MDKPPANQSKMSSKPPNRETVDEVQPQQTFENPNYRRMYGKISMDEMIGAAGVEILDTSAADQAVKETQPTSPKPTDLDFFYDDYYEDEDDEESEEFEDVNEEEDGEEQDKTKLLAKEAGPDKPKTNALSDIDLPDGWEMHDDELGSYFWHIPTGTIQRERPFLHTIDKSMIRSDSLVFLDKSAINVNYNLADSSILEEPENVDEVKTTGVSRTRSMNSKKKVIANLRLTFQSDEEEENSTKTPNQEEEEEEPHSFVVHSLGWLEVDEAQINSKTGSMAIKRTIHQLTTKPDGAARCWGVDETQRLVMRVSREKICLLDPVTETVLTIQLIREIRMWAVDEANNFAYVVRERKPSASSPDSSGSTPPLKCHVFHFDEIENESGAAQKIAIYLKEALIRIKNKMIENGKLAGGPNSSPSRPTTLFARQQAANSPPMEMNPSNLDAYEFPTPIEEPRKLLPALYMGSIPVEKPTGVEVLNVAIMEVANSLSASLMKGQVSATELMRPVVVHISPSNIVVECTQSGATIFECRVRYLSFMGISLDDVRRAGFIAQIDERQFMAHCFECDPSAGALCKTIEAACKLRYQKCLDAHAKMMERTGRFSNQRRVEAEKENRQQQLPRVGYQTSSPVAAIKSTIGGLFSKILSK